MPDKSVKVDSIALPEVQTKRNKPVTYRSKSIIEERNELRRRYYEITYGCKVLYNNRKEYFGLTTGERRLLANVFMFRNCLQDDIIRYGFASAKGIKKYMPSLIKKGLVKVSTFSNREYNPNLKITYNIDRKQYYCTDKGEAIAKKMLQEVDRQNPYKPHKPSGPKPKQQNK